MNRFCAKKGCHVSGPESKFVHCRVCDGWFCGEHIYIADKVMIMRSPKTGKSWFEAICQGCNQGLQRQAKEQESLSPARNPRKRKYIKTRLFSTTTKQSSMPQTIYQAVEDLECAGCGKAIHAGEYFTRRQRGPKDPPLQGNAHRPFSQPYCSRPGCYPLGKLHQYSDDIIV